VQVNTQKKKKEIKMPGRTALPEACGDFLFARKEKAGKKRVGEETEIMNHPGIDRHIDEHAQLGWKKSDFKLGQQIQLLLLFWLWLLTTLALTVSCRQRKCNVLL